MTSGNFYQRLGCDPWDTDSEIKRKFREIALVWHPDRNPGDEKALKRFQEITEAYATLSHPAKRAAYNQRHGFAVTAVAPRVAPRPKPEPPKPAPAPTPRGPTGPQTAADLMEGKVYKSNAWISADEIWISPDGRFCIHTTARCLDFWTATPKQQQTDVWMRWAGGKLMGIAPDPKPLFAKLQEELRSPQDRPTDAIAIDFSELEPVTAGEFEFDAQVDDPEIHVLRLLTSLNPGENKEKGAQVRVVHTQYGFARAVWTRNVDRGPVESVYNSRLRKTIKEARDWNRKERDRSR